MSETRRAHTDGTIAYSTSPAWNTSGALTSSYTGTVRFTATTTGTITITLPTNHGFTTLFLKGVRIYIGGTASITVDGVNVGTWNQTSFTTDNTYDFTYRSLSFPITLNPAKGTTQVIVLTVLTASFYFDGYDVFTAAGSVTAGRLTTIGHSVASGAGVTAAQRYSGLVAAWLGGTDDNHALTTTVLAQGSTGGGTGGLDNLITNGGPAQQPVPDWYRAVDQDAGNATWHSRTPEWAIIGYGVNDLRTRGSNDPAGATGRGYGIEMFCQRLREALWRMNANSPTTLIVVLGIGYVTHTTSTGAYTCSSGSFDATWQHGTEALGWTWSNAIAATCQEATVSNALYVDTYRCGQALGDYGLQAVATDGMNPTTDGHSALALEIYRRIQAARFPTVGRRLGF